MAEPKMNEKPSRLGRGLAALIGDMAPLHDDPYFRELQHFLDALDSGSVFLVTPQDALAALRVALAAIEAQRTGRPVDLATFEEAL